jgi:hypothetical protein
MLRISRAIACASLVLVASLLLSAHPAEAYCNHSPTVYNTGTVTGTGNTCTDAQVALQGNLQATASAQCESLYGPDAGYENYSETLNACVQNGIGKAMTGSASFTCFVCTCPRCGQ